MWVSPDETITWPMASFTERQIHFCDEHFGPEDSDTLLSLRDVAIVAGREPHAEQVDAVAGEDKDEDDEKNGDEEDLFETFAKFADDSSHVWNEDEDPERPETTKQHQKLGRRIRLDPLRHPANPDEADKEDGDVQNTADVTDQSLGREKQSLGQNLECELTSHGNDERVVRDL